MDTTSGNSDSEDDLPVGHFKVKMETQTDEDNEEMDDEAADLNMTVEAEGENRLSYSGNKIIIGKKTNKKNNKSLQKKSKFSKTLAGENEEDVSDDELLKSGDESGSETDGEVTPALSGQLDMTAQKQYLKSTLGSPNTGEADQGVPEMTLPDSFGDPITVVTIKQEYNDEDEIENIEPIYDETDIKIDPEVKIKHKNKKIREELTDAELAELNVKFVYACQVCQLEFEDCASLAEHTKSHNQVGTYLCRMCERVYQTLDDLRLHMMSHMRGGSHVCGECGKAYHHSQSLAAHRKRWHGAARTHACTVCGRAYALRNDLTTHMRSHTRDMHECGLCEKVFRTERYLRIHTKHVHLGHKFVTIECQICHKHFQKKNLLNHMKSHEEKIHKCHYCGKCMTTSYSLLAHIRRHEGVKPFVCEICNKAFVDKGKLSRHIHSHRGTRDFQCDMCEKSFSESQYLRQHKRTHDQTREYPCRICDAKFKSMNSVWSHMRKHTHTDRYECHFCGKTCYRPDHLRSHLISHTGIKDFQCEICSKRFAKSYDLTEHRRSHSGERPYHCAPCGRSFARHGEFRKHKMSKYHRERESDSTGLPPNATLQDSGSPISDITVPATSV